MTEPLCSYYSIFSRGFKIRARARIKKIRRTADPALRRRYFVRRYVQSLHYVDRLLLGPNIFGSFAKKRCFFYSVGLSAHFLLPFI
jgi:hypothetical protein